MLLNWGRRHLCLPTRQPLPRKFLIVDTSLMWERWFTINFGEYIVSKMFLILLYELNLRIFCYQWPISIFLSVCSSVVAYQTLSKPMFSFEALNSSGMCILTLSQQLSKVFYRISSPIWFECKRAVWNEIVIKIWWAYIAMM